MPQNVPNRFATKCQKIFTTTCPNQISHKMAPQIQFFQVPGLSDAPRVHRGGVNSTYPSPSSPPPEIEHQYFSSKLFGITFDNGCDSWGIGIPFSQHLMPSTVCQKPLGMQHGFHHHDYSLGQDLFIRNDMGDQISAAMFLWSIFFCSISTTTLRGVSPNWDKTCPEIFDLFGPHQSPVAFKMGCSTKIYFSVFTPNCFSWRINGINLRDQCC